MGGRLINQVLASELVKEIDNKISGQRMHSEELLGLTLSALETISNSLQHLLDVVRQHEERIKQLENK